MSNSLIDDANTSSSEETTTPESTASNEGATSTEAGWFYADGVPGNGDKPEFLDAKFKTLAEQARSYKELEKRFGSFKGAPESYKLNLPDDISIDAENPLLKSFTEKAKSLNMSQEGFNEIVNNYVQQVSEQSQAMREREMAALGEKAGERLQVLGQWATNNFDPEEVELFKRLAVDANTVKLFEKIKSKTTQTRVPEGNVVAPSEKTEESIVAKMRGDNYQRYVSDPIYRQQVQNELAQFNGEEQ